VPFAIPSPGRTWAPVVHIKSRFFVRNDDLRGQGAVQPERLHVVLSKASGPVRLFPLLEASADRILLAVRKLGLERVIAKRKGSFCEPGKRSGAWVKHRTNHQQEFIIGGYLPGGNGFDGLLVGVYLFPFPPHNPILGPPEPILSD
jgi:hypothetical protein